MTHIDMMRLAERVALQSICKRAQVGAVVRYTTWQGCVASPWTVTQGYNARPCGGQCEGADGRTLPDVTHAEDMAIQAALDAVYDEMVSGVDHASMFDSALYVTRQPCIKCAELIVEAGILSVYYRDPDDKTDGLEYLRANSVQVDSLWISGQISRYVPQDLAAVQRVWGSRNGGAA